MMDPNWLGKLLDGHGRGLTLYARQWCATPEDVVQEAFLKLMVQKKMPASVVPWLYSVVRNAAISANRSAQRRRRHEAQAAQRQSSWFLPGEEGGLDAREVTEALGELPGEQREVITLHLWGGLTFAEIAQVINVSDSTAHRWYLAGLEVLKTRFQPIGSKMEGR